MDSYRKQIWFYVLSALNDNRKTIGVFIDIKKAFVEVDLNWIENELKNMGFRGLFLSLIMGFLRERKGFIEIDDLCSEPIIYKKGVPQGSVLGPLLFIIATNRLPQVSKADWMSLFADDDGSVYYSDTNYDNPQNKVNNDLRTLQNWLS